MLVTIVVPVYNVDKYLSECIESILHQSYKNYELILVDDGSTDNSPQICDYYQQKDSRIKVFHKSNGGLMSAWKYGVERASGEYIGFVDSDDWIDENMYDRMLSVALETKADMVCSALVCEYPDGKRSFEKIKLQPGFYDKPKIEKEINPYLLISKQFHARGLSPNRVTKLFKKNKLALILDDCDERVSIGEDVVTTFAFLKVADTLYLIDDFCPYHYRINQTSMIQTFSKSKYQKIEILKETLLKVDSQYGGYHFEVQIHTDYIDLFLRIMESEMSVTRGKKLLKSIQDSFQTEKVQQSLEICDKTMLSNKDKLYLFLLRKNLIIPLIAIRRLKN